MFQVIKKFLLKGDKEDETNFSKNLKDKFTQIYAQNVFGGNESRSGEGSNIEQTAEIRQEIPKLIKELNIRSFLDAPCGDLNWIKSVDLRVEKYIGADIVEELIKQDRELFESEVRSFQCLNLVEDDLPCVDLIFCRDCLVHLSYADVRKILSNFKKSGSAYLLTTTFIDRNRNKDLGSKVWRTLNLQVAPFNFPAPLKLINEKCTEANNKFTDKCLGLWRLEDIPA